jgi:hypothetical protein
MMRFNAALARVSFGGDQRMRRFDAVGVLLHRTACAATGRYDKYRFAASGAARVGMGRAICSA